MTKSELRELEEVIASIQSKPFLYTYIKHVGFGGHPDNPNGQSKPMSVGKSNFRTSFPHHDGCNRSEHPTS